MKLWELVGPIEIFQVVGVYRDGENDCCYAGMAHGVPEELMTYNVEAVHAHEDVIDILIG